MFSGFFIASFFFFTFFFTEKLKREVWEDEFSRGLCEVYTLEITPGFPLCEDVLSRVVLSQGAQCKYILL